MPPNGIANGSHASRRPDLGLVVSNYDLSFTWAHYTLRIAPVHAANSNRSPTKTPFTNKTLSETPAVRNPGWPTFSSSFSMARYRSKLSFLRELVNNSRGLTSCGKW
ncbi:hypothetical protein RRF57_000227 [Xylaria bambusicola]|uniref:Uncharacterized protein n=1 Tax=Xylaria bambusicola TaxID=326684 RepID=A0AAN7UFB1_9PEZI